MKTISERGFWLAEIIGTRSIRELVEHYPQVAGVLAEYRLDQCCADRTIADAARLRGIPLSDIARKVEAAVGRATTLS
jgi:iron-sulfur cluster repair protein YtfE (RIC family)